MTRRTHNLIGAILCTATALLLTVMAMTGIGILPVDDGAITQGVSYETTDLKG